MQTSLLLTVLLPLSACLGAFLAPARLTVWLIAVSVPVIGGAAALVVATVYASGTIAYPMGGWEAPIGIALRADGASAAMLALAAVIFAAASLHAHAWPRKFQEGGRPLFWPLWFLLWAGVNGLLVAGDVFNLYVCLEILTLAAVALVAQSGQPPVLAAALRYSLYALFGSLLFLLGIALLYGIVGVLDLALLAENAEPSLATALAAGLMTVGLLLKTAAFPLHFWLPSAHAHAASPVSAVLSALVTKSAFFLLTRLWLGPFLPLAGLGLFDLLGALGAGALVWGSLQACFQPRLKLLIAYSTIAQIGYLFLLFPLFAAAPVEAWNGTFFQVLAHATAKAAAFLAAGNMLLAMGDDRLERIAGLGRRLRMSLFAFALAGVSLVGLPPFGGFVAKWLLLDAAISGGQWFWAVLLATAGLLTATYIVRVLGAAMTTPDEVSEASFNPVPRLLEYAALALGIAALALGLAAGPVQSLLSIGVPFDLPPPADPVQPTRAWLPVSILLSSSLCGLFIFFLGEGRARLRTVLNLSSAGLKLALVVLLLWGVYSGYTFEARLSFLPSFDLVLRADPLSLQFVTLSASLWLVTTIYAIGYLEDSPDRNRFFGFFSLSVTASAGVALSGNLITLLFFYELLTITTYPLVVHRGTEKSLTAGRTYLAYTLFGGVAVLVGAVWLQAIGGSLEFSPANNIREVFDREPTTITAIFALLMIGFGTKAAIVPLHGWLPAAMVAPAPVSALLHAVAVVKAGVFGIIRVVYDIFGLPFTQTAVMSRVLLAFAVFTIIYGSLQALRQDEIKKRLAFSTVSQLSYITFGVALAGPVATIGALVHLVHQGVMKITLFFCAGNLAEIYGIHRVSELAGIGRRMPVTMAAFTVASLGMIGLPPLAGFVSKWYLAGGTVDTGMPWLMAVFVASSALNAAYFLPIIYAAWFKPATAAHAPLRDASLWLIVPPVVTALVAVAAGLFAAWPLSPLGWAEVIAERVYYGRSPEP